MYVATEGRSRLVEHAPSHMDCSEVQRAYRAPRRPTTAIAALSAKDIVGFVLRSRFWVVISTLAGIGAGVAFSLNATPRYTASIDIMIAPSNLRIVSNDLYAANLQSDSQILDVESKMRIISSSNVLRHVVSDLNLTDDPDFESKTWLVGLQTMFGLAPEQSSDATARTLAERLKVSRQERSYVVTVSVWSNGAALSARLANAIAEAFQVEIAQGDAERARRAAQSLADRLGELKAGMSDAEDMVEAFRRSHGLQQGKGGSLVSSQALERMNDKATDARARLVEADARYREMTRALTKFGAQAGAVQSQALTSLLGEDASLQRQIASLSQTLGPRHPGMANVLAERAAIGRAIQAEIERLRRAAQSEVDQAREAVDALKGQEFLLRSTVSENDRDQIKLRELEHDAAAKTALYQSYLTRAGEAAERQQVDATDVRVISPAMAPLRPTWPPRPPIAAVGGGFLGLLFGAALAVAFGYRNAVRLSQAGAA